MGGIKFYGGHLLFDKQEKHDTYHVKLINLLFMAKTN